MTYRIDMFVQLLSLLGMKAAVSLFSGNLLVAQEVMKSSAGDLFQISIRGLHFLQCFDTVSFEWQQAHPAGESLLSFPFILFQNSDHSLSPATG